jgi:hypothetical protein
VGKLDEDFVDGLAAIEDMQGRASESLAYLDQPGLPPPADTVTTAGNRELDDIGPMISWGRGLDGVRVHLERTGDCKDRVVQIRMVDAGISITGPAFKKAKEIGSQCLIHFGSFDLLFAPNVGQQIDLYVSEGKPRGGSSKRFLGRHLRLSQ